MEKEYKKNLVPEINLNVYVTCLPPLNVKLHGGKTCSPLQQHLTPEPRPVPGTYYTLNKYLLHKRITETVKNLHHHHRIKQHTTAPAAFKTHTVDPQEAKFKEYQTWLINTALKKKKSVLTSG